ncbi:hypothetical protein AAMO2058_001745900, partial [Amorphochlora amoebiformis]
NQTSSPTMLECPPGYGGTYNGTCQECPKGRYSDSNTSECKSCEWQEGLFTTTYTQRTGTSQACFHPPLESETPFVCAIVDICMLGLFMAITCLPWLICYGCEVGYSLAMAAILSPAWLDNFIWLCNFWGVIWLGVGIAGVSRIPKYFHSDGSVEWNDIGMVSIYILWVTALCAAIVQSVWMLALLQDMRLDTSWFRRKPWFAHFPSALFALTGALVVISISPFDGKFIRRSSDTHPESIVTISPNVAPGMAVIVLLHSFGSYVLVAILTLTGVSSEDSSERLVKKAYNHQKWVKDFDGVRGGHSPYFSFLLPVASSRRDLEDKRLKTPLENFYKSPIYDRRIHYMIAQFLGNLGQLNSPDFAELRDKRQNFAWNVYKGNHVSREKFLKSVPLPSRDITWELPECIHNFDADPPDSSLMRFKRARTLPKKHKKKSKNHRKYRRQEGSHHHSQRCAHQRVERHQSAAQSDAALTRASTAVRLQLYSHRQEKKGVRVRRGNKERTRGNSSGREREGTEVEGKREGENGRERERMEERGREGKREADREAERGAEGEAERERRQERESRREGKREDRGRESDREEDRERGGERGGTRKERGVKREELGGCGVAYNERE